MKTNIRQLIDFNKVDSLLEGFNKTTGFVTALLDLDGTILSRSGWRDVCTEFHRANPETSLKCKVSDTELANKVAVGGKYHFYKCFNGLYDVAVPIIINGEHVANLFSGQFFFEKPDLSFFRKQAEKYGFDENRYMDALSRVPVVSEEKVSVAMDFLQEMTQFISDQAYQKAEIIEMSRQLEASEEKFRNAFMTGPDAININRLHDGVYVSISPSFTQIMGYTEADVVGKSSITLNIWDDVADRMRLVEGLKRDGIVRNLEARFCRKDGSLVYGLMSASVMYIDSVPHILSITRDISERKRAEENIRLAGELLEKIIDLSPIALWIADNTGTVRRVNRSLCEMINLTSSEIIGTYNVLNDPNLENQGLMPKVKAVFEELKPARFSLFWKAAESGVPEYEYASDLYMDVSLFPILGLKGELTNVVCQWVDLSEQKRAEAALKLSETHLRTLVNTLPDMIWLKDPHGVFLACNSRFESFFGVSEKELVGKTDYDFIDRELADFFRANDAAAIAWGKPRMNEEELTYASDGHRELVETIKTPMFDSDGAVTGVLGIARDITERKKTEEALRQSEKQLRAAQAVARTGSWHLDLAHDRLTWSDEVSRIFVRPAPPVTYKEFLDCIHPDDRDRLKSAWQATLAGAPYDLEHRILASGAVKWVHQKATLEYDSQGNPVSCIGTVRDITEQKKAEDELLNYRNNLEKLVDERTEEIRKLLDEVTDLYENAPCGYHSLDKEGKIIRINKTELNWLGYDLNDLLGKHVSKILTAPGLEIFARTHPELKVNRELNNIELEFLRKDGSAFTVSINSAGIFDSRNNFTGSRSTIFDISDRKIIEGLLQKAKIEAEQASRSKSEFLANMSHEIRTPMNAVLGYTELLDSIVSTPLQKQYVESIKSGGKSLLALINDILDLSKVEAGKMHLEYDYVNIHSLFYELESIFSLRVKEKKLQLIVDLPDDLPVGLLVDEARLRQVIFNLAGNAIKFTNEGSVLIKVRAIRKDHNQANIDQSDHRLDLCVEVHDSGIGIAEDKLEYIFEPFGQEHKFRHYGGTGLGLPISKRLVELMGGRLTLKSVQGEGSIFTVLIPDLRFTEKVTENIAEESIDINSISFSESLVLVVDDVRDNRELLRDMLSVTGLLIAEAANGEEAYKIALDIKPDLIITDIRMPVIDGFALLDMLKASEILKNIPVIAYSAEVLKEQKERIYNSGFSGLLVKPLKIKDLFARLMNCLPYSIMKQERKIDQTLISGTPGEPDQRAGLIRLLENELYDEWHKFERRQPVNEIRAFGYRIIETGKMYNSDILTDYGESLIASIESFNIEQLLVLIRKYPSLIASLKQ